MIIINEDTLIHTDSVSDVIEHHGVKGMKWGRRVGNWAKATAGSARRNIQHPIIANRAYRKAQRHSRLGAMMGTTRSLNYQNRYIDDMVKAKSQYKKDKKQANNKYSEDVGKISKQYEKSAFYAKRDKKNGETRSEFRKRVTNSGKELGQEYSKLGTERKDSIRKAKDKRNAAYARAGGQY